MSGRRDEGDVERVGAQRVDELVGARLPELDLHLRVAAVEAVDERGRVDHAEALLGADAQGARNLSRRVDDCVARGAFLVEHRAGVREQGEGGIGGLDAASGAREERRAELLLKPANTSGKTRLRHPHELGGARKVALIGERHQVLHLPQFH